MSVLRSKWRRLSSLPASRTAGMTAAYDNFIHYIGGSQKNPGSVSSSAIGTTTNYQYDISTDTWTTKAALPAARLGGHSEALKHPTFGWVVVVFAGTSKGLRGGLSSENGYSKNAYIYYPSVNQWGSIASFPTNNASGCCATIDNKTLNFVGGRIGISKNQYISNIHYQYDVETNTYTTKAAYPIKLRGSMAAAHDGKLYVFGGSSNNSDTGYNQINTVYMWDPATNVWTVREPMPFPINRGTATTVGDKIYIIGGQLREAVNIQTSRRVFVYLPKENKWEEEHWDKMPTARYWTNAEVVDGQIYVMGGWNGSAVNVCEVFDCRTPSIYFVNPETLKRFSDISGNVMEYLDFGLVMAGQTSPIKKVYIESNLDFPVKNVRAWIDEESVSEGITVELSKTLDPFEPVNSISWGDETLSFGERFEFYVRFKAEPSVDVDGTFRIRLGDAKPA